MEAMVTPAPGITPIIYPMIEERINTFHFSLEKLRFNPMPFNGWGVMGFRNNPLKFRLKDQEGFYRSSISQIRPKFPKFRQGFPGLVVTDNNDIGIDFHAAEPGKVWDREFSFERALRRPHMIWCTDS